MSKANNLLDNVGEIKSELLTENVSLLSANEIPTWMNEDYFQNIIQEQLAGETSKVKSIEVQKLGGKGESYIGIMYRVGVKLDSDVAEFRSFIVKTLPDEAIDTLGKNNYDVQGKEMKIYSRIEPQIRKILKSIDEDAEIFPASPKVDEALEVIVMEDLVEKNFVLVDRFKGLDMEHTKMVLRKLARLHAASVVLHASDPSAFKNHDMGIFARKSNIFDKLFISLNEIFADEVATWEGHEYYAEKLRKVAPNVIENVLKCFDCEDGDLHVLTHGDLWSNNMMFKYDSTGQLIDCVLLDLQFSSYASPAIDLLYFIFTSSMDDMRTEVVVEECVHFYYYQLKDLLGRLDYNMETFPSLHQFHIQILRKYFYVYASCFLMFPIITNDNENANAKLLFEFDEEGMAFKRSFYKNVRFQAIAKSVLPLLDRYGILDDM